MGGLISHFQALSKFGSIEKILLHLSVKELFVVQRVHSHFKLAIQQSDAIQQKMFLRHEKPGENPEDDANAMEVDNPSDASPTFNTLGLQLVEDMINTRFNINDSRPHHKLSCKPGTNKNGAAQLTITIDPLTMDETAWQKLFYRTFHSSWEQMVVTTRPMALVCELKAVKTHMYECDTSVKIKEDEATVGWLLTEIVRECCRIHLWFGEQGLCPKVGKYDDAPARTFR